MIRNTATWWTTVKASDPIRRMLNRGLAIAIAVWIILIIMVIAAFVLAGASLFQILGTSVLLPAFAVAWWVNRHGTTGGAVLVTILVVLSIIVTVDIHKYFSESWGHPIIVDATLIIPILVGAFFWRPSAAIWATFAEILLLCLTGDAAGFTQDRILNFAIFGTLTLLPTTTIATLFAWMYQRALRHALDLIPEKEHTLDLILADYDDHPGMP